ncbi:MAG: Flp family type IVb pilin [Chlamydiales bacterium]|nr:Flp family type IVb pilin [Chlamydiales bacterium]
MNNYSKNKIKGATMVEYVLILGLISIAAVAILQSIGVNILALFTKVNTAIPKQ